MKKCKDCGKYKDESMFYGCQRECKECTKKRVKLNSEKVGNRYDFSEKGVFRVIYKTQKRHQKLRGHGELPYTKDQLIEWCKSKNFDDIYSRWVASGYKKDTKPSIDRVDDFRGYSFDNITLGTWFENRKHQYSDIKNAKGTGGLRCKPVLKLDSNMSIICEYASYSSAVRDTGYSIEYQIKKSVKCRNGFYWVYK